MIKIKDTTNDEKETNARIKIASTIDIIINALLVFVGFVQSLEYIGAHKILVIGIAAIIIPIWLTLKPMEDKNKLIKG